MGCGDAALNSILCSNRAHVNLLLGNFRNAYQDGLAALRHNDQNIKVPACMRGRGGGQQERLHAAGRGHWLLWTIGPSSRPLRSALLAPVAAGHAS